MKVSWKKQFPLPLGAVSYEEEKRHSDLVDQWLGFDFEKGENFVELEGQVSWRTKGPATFLTPYSECQKILDELQLPKGSTLVDFGAGYGRMGHVMESLEQDYVFLGYELISSRVIEANRVAEQWGRAFRLIKQDMNSVDFEIPTAQAYFLYDFGSESQILDLLEELRLQRGQRSFQMVARGGRVRHLIQKQHPWLWAANEPKHWSNFSIYKNS